MPVGSRTKRAAGASSRTLSKAKSEARHVGRTERRWADHVVERLPRPIRAVVSRARRDDTLLFAASLAFYATVSIVPLVMLILSVVSLLLGDQRVHSLAEEVGRMAPKNLGADRLLLRVSTVATRTSIVAFVTGLWPATSYGSGLVRAFDELSPKPDRRAPGLRGRGLALVLLLPFFVVGALIGSYAGSQALGSSTFGRVAGAAIALVTGFVGAAGGIALIYWIFPPERLSLHQIVVATATTAGAITFLSLVLTLYVALGANFEQHYATSGLAAFVLVAVWLFRHEAALTPNATKRASSRTPSADTSIPGRPRWRRPPLPRRSAKADAPWGIALAAAPAGGRTEPAILGARPPAGAPGRD
jgi:membrane protein